MPKVTPRIRPLRRTFIRHWREFRELNQDQAAERIGIDRSQLSRIENGKAPYNQAFLEAAAYAYRCDPADLLMRNPLDDDAIWTLIDVVRGTSSEKQKQISAVIETLLKTGT